MKWFFQYRAAGTAGKRWEFIGGAPLYVRDDTSRTRANTAYGDLTSPLSLTIPLAGDYDITIEADLFVSTNGYSAVLSYAVGATAASDAWAVSESNTITSVSGSKTTRHTGISASASIAEKAKASGGTGTFLNRRLSVLPVRVG